MKLSFCTVLLFAVSATSSLLAPVKSRGISASEPVPLQDTNHTLSHVSASDSTVWRNLSVILDVDVQASRYRPQGSVPLPGHMALWLAGTSTNGPLQIEYVRSERGQVALRVYDWNLDNSHRTLSPHGAPGYNRRIYQLGQTTITNAELADPNTGRGLVVDAYQVRPGYRSDGVSGIHFLRALSDQLGLTFASELEQVFHQVERHQLQQSLPHQSTLALLLDELTVWGDGAKTKRVCLGPNVSNGISFSSAVETCLDATTPLFPDAASPELHHKLRRALPEPWEHSTTPDDFYRQAISSPLVESQASWKPRDSTHRAFSSVDRWWHSLTSLALSARQAVSPRSREFLIISMVKDDGADSIAHSAVYIKAMAGSSNNPPLKIERTFGPNEDEVITKVTQLPFKDRLPKETPDKKPVSRSYLQKGQTTLSNDQLFDPSTMKGFAMDVLKKVGVYRLGVSDCQTYTNAFTQDLGAAPDPKFQQAVATSNQIYEGKPSLTDGQKVAFDTPIKDASGKESTTKFSRQLWDVSDPSAPKQLAWDGMVNQFGKSIDADGKLLPMASPQSGTPAVSAKSGQSESVGSNSVGGSSGAGNDAEVSSPEKGPASPLLGQGTGSGNGIGAGGSAVSPGDSGGLRVTQSANSFLSSKRPLPADFAPRVAEILRSPRSLVCAAG